jgi:eukaryotic-like serine/threonine-protein kinase
MTGRTVSHYRITEKLGGGGMGVVYKAEDLKLHRTVALKFLPPDLTRDEEAKKRFIHEAQAASTLDHPNICNIHEINETEDGQIFIAMTCYEGESLKEKIEKGPLPIQKALDIASQIARGLEKAHAEGIVHRDIKPANIFITKDGQVKIIDFGLAKLTGRTLLTITGSTLGTVAYMSPEQAQGANVDHRSDIWAFGVILYEMLTGKPPFAGDYEQAVIYSIINEDPKAVTEIRSDIPLPVEQIVSRAMERNPDKRYLHIKELLDDLEALLAGIVPDTIQARLRKEKLGRARKYVYTGIIVIMVLLIAGLFILPWLFHSEEEIDKSIAVVPFHYLSNEPDKQYLADGVMEAILLHLSKIHDLRVVSRTSVEQYRETNKNVNTICSELGVAYLMEGSFQKFGNTAKLIVQLIQPGKEQHIWANEYDRNWTDIFAVQSEVAQAVARELQVAIATDEKQLIEKIPTTDLTVYDTYLKGKFNMYDAFLDNTAMELFELAIERDPEFAPAYAGMANVWMFRQQMGYASPEEALPKIMEAVEKALELDSTLAEVHYTLANMNYLVIWDWEEGERAFNKAIDINPNYAEAHALYSHLLIILGRPEEAMGHAELALKLDPHNPGIIMWYSAYLLFERRYDECISFSREFYEKNPTTFWFLSIGLYIALHMKERYDEAFEALKLAISTQYKDFDQVFDQYEKLGYTATLNLEADRLLEQSKTKYISQFDIACIYALAGNKEQALDCLGQAYEMHDPVIPYVGVYPNFIILHDEPRYQELLRKMNLPLGEIK